MQLGTSIFGRSGAVTAQTGDYTVAQVTNAVDSAGSFSDPAWIASLSATKLTTGSIPLARIGQNGATTGQALAWSGSAWAPATISGAGGYATVESNGSAVTQRTTLNFIPSTDISLTPVDATTKTNVQATIDSTKWLTRATAVGGTDRYLTGTSASGSAYVVAPVGNPLTAYTDGQTFNWKPDVTASGNHTVAISGLAAKKTYQADGTTRAGASDVIAGRGVLIQYDSTLDAAAGGFKIVNAGGAAAGGDFSSNTSSSVDSEIVLFSSTAGKTGKRATGTGLPHVTSGVLSVSSPTNHGVMVGQGSSAPVATSAGTTGQVLTSNGASADPTFQAATGGSPGTYWGSASSGKTAGSAFCTITGVTTATPAVVTCSSAHFASTGQHRYVSGVGGMGGVNNTAHPYYWTITLVDTTRYSLDGSTGTGTYTSGGTANDSTVHCYSGGGSGQPTCLNAYMPVATT